MPKKSLTVRVEVTVNERQLRLLARVHAKPREANSLMYELLNNNGLLETKVISKPAP